MVWPVLASMAVQGIASSQATKQGGDGQGSVGTPNGGGGGGGGFTLGSSDKDQSSIRTGAINIQPVGLNLGSILQPFTDNAAHGGAGLDPPSPFAQPGSDRKPFKPDAPAMAELKSDSVLPLALGVGGILVFGSVVVFATRRRR